MWIDPLLVDQLDNPAGRGELARVATDGVRARLPGVDIEVLWDEMWIRRVGPHFFPDPDMLRVKEPRWKRWGGQAEKHLRDADDYWFHVYKRRRGDVIVDIGAGRGEDVFAFSRAVGAEGRVFAVEPHPVSFQVLKKLCALNGLANVTAINFACVDQPAQLQIETLPVWESNYIRVGEQSPTSHPVEGLTFDTLADRYGLDRIDFLKMNIEGAERTALPGCRETMQRVGNVCISAHDFRADRGEGEVFRTLAFVKEFLVSAGFQLTTRDDDPRYYVPYHVHGVRGPT